jgi:hypothetical protein
MTMLTNAEIQTAIIAYLKGITAITSTLKDIDGVLIGAKEIREDQWQGTEFEYPNIRVRMISNNPFGDSDQCDASTFTVSIMTFSQSASSLEAEQISGIISTSLHAKSFVQGTLSIFLRTTNLIPAVRADMRTWRAECLMQGVATK